MALKLGLPLLPCRKKQTVVLMSSYSSSSPFVQQKVNPHSIHCLSTANAKSSSSAPPRRTANFPPTIWDDSYIQSLPTDFTEEKYVNRRDKLMEEVRCLIGQQHGLIEQLELMDALRQLGLAYHFDADFKDLLSFISSSMENISSLIENNNLHGTALLFRLLREYGINDSILSVDVLISCFKNARGSFKFNHEHDVKGMLSLYEASYLAVEDEEELDEAGEFSLDQLRNLNRSLLDPQLVEKIDHALELPLHWRMPRLHTRWYIDVYERQENVNPILLKLAKLDFNMVQSIYKKELKEMSRWWRTLGLVCDELHFARDRLVEHYLWATGFIFRPEFWRCRKAITKIICVITIIDDIYDIYGTLGELELFTYCVNKWEITTTRKLPECMKICLTSFFKTMNDIAYTFLIEKGLDVLPCLKQVSADLCKAFLMEARWYHTGYTPTTNEYLENAWVSIAGICELIVAYCLSDDLTIEALNNLQFYPDIVRLSCMLFRLYDDLGTVTAEIQRGDVPKSIQCYKNETNVSESAARDYIRCLIRKYWKALNEKLATSTKCIKSFQEAIVDTPRMAQCFYQYGDGHGEPNQETRDKIIMLLIEPITLYRPYIFKTLIGFWDCNEVLNDIL